MALAEGILALQLHAGLPMWTEFKNTAREGDSVTSQGL